MGIILFQWLSDNIGRLVCAFRSHAGVCLSIGLVSVLLSNCGQLSNPNLGKTDNAPDVMDRVRSIDLLPRFPREVANENATGDRRVKPGVFPTSASSSTPDQGGASTDNRPVFQAAPAGDGYELNFD